MVLVLFLKFVRDRFFSGTPVSSTNKTDRHDIAEILLKVTLSTINQNQTLGKWHQFSIYTYFLFQNVITSLLRSAQGSYYLLFSNKYESDSDLDLDKETYTVFYNYQCDEWTTSYVNTQ